MDDFFIHLEPFPRRMPTPLRVQGIGHMPRKDAWVGGHTFTTLNFSYLLGGQGRYRHGEREWLVQAPAVLMQWPGASLAYGPEPEGAAWEELFVLYSGSLLEVVAGWGVDPEVKPVWQVRESGFFREQAALVLEAAHDAEGPGWADRLDRLCERLLLEARLGEASSAADPADAALRSIRKLIARDLGHRHDFDALARRHGMAPITFRRRWNRRYGEPPHRYLLNLRMREAQRLLVETTLPVGEIAARLGFDDPLYFSRRFSHAFGTSASDYRHSQWLNIPR